MVCAITIEVQYVRKQIKRTLRSCTLYRRNTTLLWALAHTRRCQSVFDATLPQQQQSPVNTRMTGDRIDKPFQHLTQYFATVPPWERRYRKENLELFSILRAARPCSTIREDTHEPATINGMAAPHKSPTRHNTQCYSFRYMIR